MSVDVMCNSTYCPLKDICTRKQSTPTSRQPYQDYAPECLPGGNMSRFYIQATLDEKPVPFKAVWELMSSRQGGNYYYKRQKWNETYHSRNVFLYVQIRYDGVRKYLVNISPDGGGVYNTEDWYPTLEDITAIDWVVMRR